MKNQMKKIIAILNLIMFLTIFMQTSVIASVITAKQETYEIIDDIKDMEYEEGEVIISYKQNDNISVKRSTAKLKDPTIKNDIIYEDNEGTIISHITAEKSSTEDLIKKFKNNGNILSIEPNYIIHTSDITNDTYEKYQWAIENSGQNAGISGRDINTFPATKENKDEKVIAVVDTGVDYTHPDLKNAMWHNNTTVLDGLYGYDFVNNDNDPMDDNEHGTHCAGIIAATSNNNEGITGALLDNNNVKIMALKISDANGKGNLSSAISAYKYIIQAQEAGVNVVAINNSWGGTGTSDTLNNLIDQSGQNGALSICAAGNESLNIDTTKYFPSGLDSEYIISVAASNEKDELADFSNYGSNNVDIAAPGTNILSTVPYNVFNPSIYSDSQIKTLCSKYEDFGGNKSEIDSLYELSSDDSGNVGETKINSQSYFGTRNNQSLEWNIDAKSGKTYNILFKLDTALTSDQIARAMVKINNSSTDGRISGLYSMSTGISNVISDTDLQVNEVNYWDALIFNYPAGTKYIGYRFVAKNDCKFSLIIDDFAVSKAGVNKNNFGKYEFLNGTSMATPYVTAAIGVLSNELDNNTPLNIKAQVLNSARKSSIVNGKVQENRILDIGEFNKLENNNKVRTSLSDKSISIANIYNKQYTGKGITQNPKIIYDNSYTLKEGTDYTVSYSNNINVGLATIIIKGMGNYKGTIEKRFQITPISLNDCSISEIYNKTYTGNEIRQNIKVAYGSIVLKEGTDYTLTYKNNINVGTAEIIIVAKGNYTGTIIKTFIINPKNVTGLKLSSPDKTSLKIKWDKQSGVSGYEIYMYNSSKKNYKYIGRTTNNSYTIKKLKAGTTYSFKVRAYKSVDGKNRYGAYSSVLKTATKTNTPKISKLTSSKKTLTAKWKKVSGSSGYEVYIATSKKGKYTKKKTINSSKTTSAKIKKLKSRKNYYVKIRTFKTVSGKKIYSSYSSVKKIKVK